MHEHRKFQIGDRVVFLEKHNAVTAGTTATVTAYLDVGAFCHIELINGRTADGDDMPYNVLCQKLNTWPRDNKLGLVPSIVEDQRAYLEAVTGMGE